MKKYIIPFSSIVVADCGNTAQDRTNIIYVFPDQFWNSAMAFWDEPDFAPYQGWRAEPVQTPNLDMFAR